MNQFYKVVDLLKTRLSENTNVNTVLFGRTEDKDLYKKNIYPIAHINPVGASFGSRTTIFSFEIAALDQRDISNAIMTDKFEGNDDVQDNLNVTSMILSDLVSWLTRQNNDDLIELASVSSAQPLLFKDHNLLDGWVIKIDLEIPNNISVC